MHRFLYDLACYAYAHGLRDLIKKAIDDPAEVWDDIALAVMDRIFNYHE